MILTTMKLLLGKRENETKFTQQTEKASVPSAQTGWITNKPRYSSHVRAQAYE